MKEIARLVLLHCGIFDPSMSAWGQKLPIHPYAPCRGLSGAQNRTFEQPHHSSEVTNERATAPAASIGRTHAQKQTNEYLLRYVRFVPIVLQKSPSRLCEIEICNNRIGASIVLNRCCSFMLDLESIFRDQMPKILLQQYLPIATECAAAKSSAIRLPRRRTRAAPVVTTTTVR